MPVTPDDVRRVAQFAGLYLSPAEEDELVQRIGQIIGYMETLEAVATEGVEPLIHPLAGSPAPLRPDTARPGLPLEQALANAPDRHGPFYKVPSMIEETADD